LVRCGGEGSKPLVAINPVAKWATKLWSIAKFAKLADRLIAEHDARIVFTGSQSDREVIARIGSLMKHEATNLAGETNLKILAALYERTRVAVVTDTGPMHLAAAVGTPVVALFGPTAPWRTGPSGSGHQVIRVGLECSPCFKRQCPSIECMEKISVEQVLDGILKLGIL
jgi:lipopolysaccharide heptosyltransferase II